MQIPALILRLRRRSGAGRRPGMPRLESSPVFSEFLQLAREDFEALRGVPLASFVEGDNPF